MKWERVQFATVANVIETHDSMIETGGGAEGVFHHHGIEASVMAVQATYGGVPLLATLADIAAGYAFYITTSHPFIDGNKRTALITALTFLEVNGYDLMLARFDEWQDIMVDVAKGLMTREKLAEFFAAAMGKWGELT